MNVDVEQPKNIFNLLRYDDGTHALSQSLKAQQEYGHLSDKKESKTRVICIYTMPVGSQLFGFDSNARPTDASVASNFAQFAANFNQMEIYPDEEDFGTFSYVTMPRKVVASKKVDLKISELPRRKAHIWIFETDDDA